ncbi:MAG: aldo/keto reductase, partial [Myxococcales bacterium]|nr:aldo/keto reductase [Myxococcales bacterium]
DMYTHPEEVADALTTLREAGKIREAGVSNYTPQQTAALVPYLPFPLVSQQPEFSALQLDPLRNGVLDQCMERKMVPLAWSPLAGGRIPRGSTDVPKELLSVLDQLGEREGVTRSSVALGFILAHPSKPVCIIGTQNSERIREMARDTSITLDRHDVYRIIQASDGTPLP